MEAGASRWSMPIPSMPRPAASRGRARAAYDLTPGRTHAQLFPLKLWRRLILGQLAHGGAAGLTDSGEPAGLPALRSAIATHLAATRGVSAEPHRIFVTSGIQEGAGLLARLFLNAGSLAAMEDPGPSGVRLAFEATGAEVVGVAVDSEGLATDDLPRRPTALFYVTPSHQFPTGHGLGRDRAETLIAWARRTGCYLVEDDRDGEFRYDGPNPPALAAGARLRDLPRQLFAHARGPGSGLASSSRRPSSPTRWRDQLTPVRRRPVVARTGGARRDDRQPELRQSCRAHPAPAIARAATACWRP